MNIYCCGCKKEVEARLTNGGELYPHRHDLRYLPFWICGNCKSMVGCHHKTNDRTRPLGFLATAELRRAKKEIHKILDPIWKNGTLSRKQVYALISKSIGYQFHTAEIKSLEDGRKAYRVILEIANGKYYDK